MNPVQRSLGVGPGSQTTLFIVDWTHSQNISLHGSWSSNCSLSENHSLNLVMQATCVCSHGASAIDQWFQKTAVLES